MLKNLHQFGSPLPLKAISKAMHSGRLLLFSEGLASTEARGEQPPETRTQKDTSIASRLNGVTELALQYRPRPRRMCMGS